MQRFEDHITHSTSLTSPRFLIYAEKKEEEEMSERGREGEMEKGRKGSRISGTEEKAGSPQVMTKYSATTEFLP
jgi:hypothetical protein